MFNALGSLGEIEGARVVDLFAGSGAVGIEALSRGAVHCTFVEKDKRALATLRGNLSHLGLEGASTVVDADAPGWVRSLARTRPGAETSTGSRTSVDILIADPPYGFTEWNSLLEGVRAGLVVLESDHDPGHIDGWVVVRSKRYGRTHVTFLRAVDWAQGTVGEQ